MNIFVSKNGKAFCLICRESTGVLKEYNIVTHCSSKHTESTKLCQHIEKEKVAL
jgi:hypothetical protein